MSQLPYRQSANVKRRTWDREAYEAKAKQQQTPSAAAAATGFSAAQPPSKRPRTTTGDDNDDDDDGKEEFRPAAPNAAKAHNSKRALLQSRQHRVTDIDSKVGKVELVSAEQVATSKSAVVDDNAVSHKDGVFKTGVGWHCKVCDCYLKDSHTYLDHINGRKHQRKLGYTMRVERNTKEQVDETLQQLVQAKHAAEQSKSDASTNVTSLADLVKVKDEEAQRRREERRARRKQRHGEEDAPHQPPIAQAPQLENPAADDDAGGDNEAEEDEDIVEEAEIDPALAAMMGFSGFGSSKKS